MYCFDAAHIVKEMLESNYMEELRSSNASQVALKIADNKNKMLSSSQSYVAKNSLNGMLQA